MNQENNPQKRYIYMFILIIILGFFLRFYQLDTESMWKDEAYTYHHVQKSPSEMVLLVIQTEAAPPAYYLILHYWLTIFGNTVFILRLLSVLFSTISLIIIFLICKKIFDQKTSLLATFFMATFVLETVYAQQIRLYSFFTTISLISSLFLMLYLQQKKKIHLILYSLSLVLCLYTNYLTLFLIMIHLFFLFYQQKYELNKENKKAIFFAISFPVFIFLFWLPSAFTQLSWAQEKLEISLYDKGLPLILSKFGLLILAIPITAITSSIFLIIYIKKKHFFLEKINKYKKQIQNIGIIIAIVIPIFFLVSLNRILVSFALIRYILFLFPIGYILIAWKITTFHKKSLQMIIVTTIILFNVFTVYTFYHNTYNTPWNKTAEIITNYNETNPTILFDKSGFASKTIFEYYYTTPYNRINLAWTDEKTLEYKSISEIELQKNIQLTQSLWLIQYNSKNNTYYPKIIEKEYTLNSKKELKDIIVYNYNIKQLRQKN